MKSLSFRTLLPLWTAITLIIILSSEIRVTSAASTRTTPVTDKTKIDKLVKKIMGCYHTQALGISVVKDGKVIMSSGYGTTKPKNGQTTTSNTKFCLGSVTKSFTGLLAAKIFKESTLYSLDTPIVQYINGFRQTDDYRSQNANLRDLLSHRMALPSPVIPIVFGIDPSISRTAFASQYIPLLKGTNSFREKPMYNNYMVILAGYILEQFKGQSIEKLTSDAIFSPLSMTDSDFFNETTDFSDFAYPIDQDENGTSSEIDPKIFLNAHIAGGAGAMTSTPDDMAKYMNMMLKQTRVAGITDSIIKDTFTSGMYCSGASLTKPVFPVSHVDFHYALGWKSGLYRGHRLMSVDGGINTHVSTVWLFPDVNAGVFVTTNAPMNYPQQMNLRRGILYHVADILLGLNPWFQQDDVCADKKPWDRPPSPTAKPSPAVTSPTTSPTPVTIPNLNIYTGVYTDVVFGDARIEVDSGQLRLRYGRYGDVKLTPESKIKFKGEYQGIVKVYQTELPLQVVFTFDKTSTNCVMELELAISTSPKHTQVGPFVKKGKC